jgi:serine/threonine protein kinase
MTMYKVYVLWEFPQRTLEDEINERIIQKRRFQEKELWSILASCILGLSHLQKEDIKHNALKSGVILISPDGYVKLFDPLATGTLSNYEKLLTKRAKPHLYLSP